MRSDITTMRYDAQRCEATFGNAKGNVAVSFGNAAFIQISLRIVDSDCDSPRRTHYNVKEHPTTKMRGNILKKTSTDTKLNITLGKYTYR